MPSETPASVRSALVGPGETRIGPVVLQPVTIRHLLAIEHVDAAQPAVDRPLYGLGRTMLLCRRAAAEVLQAAREAAADPARTESEVAALLGELSAADLNGLAARVNAHLDAPFANVVEGSADGPFVGSAAAPADH